MPAGHKRTATACDVLGWASMPATADVFAERLLQVIDEGQRTATYKLALLLALMDAGAARADADGRAPAALHTRTIAEHVLRLYLPQVRLYLGIDQEERHLRQITDRRKASTVLAAVLRLELAGRHHGIRTPGELARRLPDEYVRCLDTVEHTFARYPIVHLQTVGRTTRPFLYEIDWGESVGLTRLHRPGGGMVRFFPGAGDHLLRLAPLLRPLIELHWTRMVAKLNDLDTEGERLREHLFGATRSSFPAPLRRRLAELQEGACFFCGDRLPVQSHIDHFIPWVRWPNDAVENLVLADGACNGDKRHHLAALEHVDRWARRLVADGPALDELGAATGWERDAPRSLALARSAYAHLPAGTLLWRRAGEFVDDDPDAITRRLADVPDLTR